MDDKKPPKITLIGAGGLSFAPVMVSDILHTPRLHGATLALMDVSEKRLDTALKVAERMNDAMGRPVSIEPYRELELSVKGADFAMISVEVNRWKGFDEDYYIPRKYGSKQMMGENGGPGGVFHALRTVPLVTGICKRVEKVNPKIFIINFTNPMVPVTLAINRETKLANAGLCHEFTTGMVGLMKTLLMRPSKIAARASGLNHFTWFYEIKHADTGEDLYPKVKRRIEQFPFAHWPLGRYCLKKYGLVPTTTDDHFGEYLPYAGDVAHSAELMRSFYKLDGRVRDFITKRYAKGKFPLPVKTIPRSHEEAVPIVEALAMGDSKRFNSVNVPNVGYIPNLPKGVVVEVGMKVENGKIIPDNTPPMQDELADIMRSRSEITDATVDAALNGDRKLAFDVILAEPNSPADKDACRKMFDEMAELQKDLLPF